jgi:type II secretory pathway pseudopilin PulG
VHDHRGFTLIDTLVSAGLCAVMGAMALPMIGRTLDRERTIIGTQYLAGQLQRARIESLTRARSAAVRLELIGERSSVQLFVDGDGDGVLQRDIDLGVDPPLTPMEFLDVHARDVSLRINQSIVDAVGSGTLSPGDDPLRIGGSALLSFSPLGSATAGTLYVAARRGPQMAIRVFGGTGRVRILTFDAQARQWRQ